MDGGTAPYTEPFALNLNNSPLKQPDTAINGPSGASSAILKDTQTDADNLKNSQLQHKSGTAVNKKRQKLQPFKFLPPDSFGKSKVGMLENSGKLQQIKSFPKP